MTPQLNKALHLYLQFVADAFNELGMEYEHDDLHLKGVTSRYTKEIVKEKLWRKVQITMFGCKSTTKLTSKDANEIIDCITKYFGNKGIVIEFPKIKENDQNANRNTH